MLEVFRGHTDDIRSLAYTPDGRFAISGSRDLSLCVWQLATGEPITMIGVQQYCEWLADAVSVGPEGRYLARNGGNDLLVHDLARVTPRKGGRIRHIAGWHDSTVTDVEFSPDGRFAASCGVDWTVRVWELSTGGGVGVFRGHNGQVSAIDYAPDGRTILSGGVDTTLRLWDIPTGKCLRVFEGHTGPVWSVAVSPDGNYGLPAGDGCKLWDLRTGRCLRTFGGEAVVGDVAFSPDGRFFVAGSLDKTVTLWNTETGARLHTFSTHDRVTKVAFSPDGCTAISDGVQDAFVLWDLAGIEGYYDQKHFDQLAKVAACRRLMATGQHDQAEMLASNLDTRVVPEMTVNRLQRDSRAERVYKEAAKQLRDLAGRREFLDAEALYRQVRPDVFFRHEMALRKIIDTARIEKRVIPRDLRGATMHLTDDLRFAATLQKDRTVQIWSVQNWERLGVFQSPEHALVARVGPNGRHVLCIGEKALEVWDVQQGERLWTHRLPRGAITASALKYKPVARFSRNGKYIIAVTKRAAMVWETSTGREIGVIEGRRGYMESADVSDDGQWVVTSSADGTVHVQATGTGELRWARVLKRALSDVRFGADGKRVFCADGERLEVIDVHSGRLLQAMSGTAAVGFPACHEPHPRYVVTSCDGVARLFDLEANRCVWFCDVMAMANQDHALGASVEGVAPNRLITVNEGRLWSVDLTGLMDTVEAVHTRQSQSPPGVVPTDNSIRDVKSLGL